MSNFEQLVFEIIAKDKDASAAFARFRRQVDDTSKSVDKSSASLDKNAQSLDKNKQHATSAMGALIGVGTAFAPVTAGAAAAGLGFSAFAALAVPSILKVTTALSSKGGGLAAQWATLDNRQRVAAVGVQALMERYTGLAKAMEPQVFQVFNTSLGLANSLLGPTAKLAQSAGQGIESFLIQFSQRAGLQQFITDMSKIAGPSFALLGDDITHIAHAVFQLLQAFSGTGLLELRLLSGVFTALDDSITFLSQHAPALTSVAISIGGVALALAKVGALGSVLKITGLASIAGQMAGFAAATEGATLAEKGLLATTTVLDAVTPLGWAILATAAVTGLVVVLSRFKSGTDATIASIEKQNDAQGFNTAGYFAAAKAVGAYADSTKGANENLVNLHTGMVTGTTDAGQLSGATSDLTAAQRRLVTEGSNQETFLTMLQAKYGLTRDAAVSLAEHSGVLASEVGKGGQAMKDATAKADAYANSNLNAQQPTTQLAKDMSDFANSTLGAVTQTKALTAALNVFFNPAVTADQALITLAGDADTAAAALKASGGQTAALTGKQGAARSAFDTYISQVATTASQVFAATGKTGDYNRIIDANIPKLRSMAAGNKTLQGLIQELIDTENRIPKTETTHIIVHGDGTFSVQGNAVKARAEGGLITGGTPGRDSVLAALMPGEVVVPTRMVSAGAVDHLRGQLPGFASGGVVGSYSGSVPGLAPWMAREETATQVMLEKLTAAATAAAIKVAQTAAFSGGAPGGAAIGAGAAAAQAYARSILHDYGWGPTMFPPLQSLWNGESGWNYKAYNAASGATGIPQSLPGSKMASAGADWRTNPATQIRWGLGYIKGRYGNPATAYSDWLARSPHWYAGGTGGAAPGWGVVGEQGKELVRFHGGEEVLPHSMTSRILSGTIGMPGYAAGTKPSPQQAKWLAELARDVASRDKLAVARTRSDHARQLALTAEELAVLQHPHSKADARKLAAARGALGKWEARSLAPISFLNKEITLLRTLTGNPDAVKYGGPGAVAAAAAAAAADAAAAAAGDASAGTAAAPSGPAPGIPVTAVGAIGGPMAWPGALPPPPSTAYAGPVAGVGSPSGQPGGGCAGGQMSGQDALISEIRAMHRGIIAAVSRVAPGVSAGTAQALNGLARGVVST